MASKKVAFLYEVFLFQKYLKQMEKSIEDAEIVFFFPAYHLGGAERVHADILANFADYRTHCVLTVKSVDDFFKEDFTRYTEITDIGSLRSLVYPYYAKRIASLINRKAQAIVFGCNSRFFYQMLPYLKPNVKVIDLLHAFSFDANAAESISLPVAERIDTRIVLGEKTKGDFRRQYREAGKPESLLERIKIIPNKVDAPAVLPQKPENEKLKILFVGRNSPEKRPELFLEIAKKAAERKLPAEFYLIGDFEGMSVPYPNVHIVGSIREKARLNTYYQSADLLLITSWREGLPMVVLEGMAYGVVPVSTDVGEIAHFINDKNRNGWIVPDDTLARYAAGEAVSLQDLAPCVECFIKQIEYALENQAELAEYRENAYRSVKQDFSAETNRKAYLALMAENGLKLR
ncbi:MAG: glycosyltransferase family 4 protein [Neisseria sp.]|nr:glycosyltransferase family 4 protein [Neisseria sp.]